MRRREAWTRLESARPRPVRNIRHLGDHSAITGPRITRSPTSIQRSRRDGRPRRMNTTDKISKAYQEYGSAHVSAVSHRARLYATRERTSQ